MFCSHCGKKIEDGSAFCSGCGKAVGGGQSAAPSAPAPVQQVVYVNQVKKEGIVGAPEEVRKKIAVIIMYSLGAVALLVLILSVLATKLKVFAEFMDFTGISQGSFEEALEHMYDEYGLLIAFLSVLLLLPKVVEGVVLWKSCGNRNFAVRDKNVIVRCVGSSICWIIVPPILVNGMSGVSERLGNASLSGSVYFIIALVVIYKISYAILYHVTSRCERTYISMEERKKRNSWVCDNCGMENDRKYEVCQRCGEVHGIVKKKSYWICKNCNTENDSKDLYCKFCGKYK